jgi:hypothetical protein
LAYPVNGAIFLGLDFLLELVNVLIVGLIVKNRGRIAQAVFNTVMLLHIASPYSLFFGHDYIPLAAHCRSGDVTFANCRKGPSVDDIEQ